jgi:proton glutamate symport protein
MRNLVMILVALGLGAKRHWHVFFAIVLGALVGVLLPYNSTHPDFLHQTFEVIGQMFIRLVAMLAIPLVISSLIIGVTSLGDGRQLGKMGIKTIFYFGVTMLVAATVGAIVAYFIHPGTYFPASLNITSGITPFHVEQPVGPLSLQQMFLNLVPQNPFESLAKRDLVPVIIFTLMFGTAMAFIGDTARPFIAFFEAIFAATMKIVDWVMIFAVPGVFSLTFTAMSHFAEISHGSMSALFDLLEKFMPFVLSVLIALLIQAFVVFPTMLYFLARINFIDLYWAISEALLVAFGTASSSATLPVTLASIERRGGVSNRVASFVLPAGVSMNLNGTAIFEVVAVMFLAQLYGVPTSLATIISIIVLAIIASIGAAGVPSAGMITMSIVLNGVGGFRPDQVAAGLSLLWVVDRVLDMCRTTVSVMSDCVVASIIAAGEGELNREMLASGESWEEVVQ